MILTKMKGYLLAAWSLLLSLGTFLLTFFVMRSGKNRREKKQAEARANHAKKVMETDLHIDREHDTRTEDLLREIEKKKHSDELSRPNLDWRDG